MLASGILGARGSCDKALTEWTEKAGAFDEVWTAERAVHV